jgi:hypothetical protein
MADIRPDQLSPFEMQEKLRRTPLLGQLRDFVLGVPDTQGPANASRDLGVAGSMKFHENQKCSFDTIKIVKLPSSSW